MKLLDKYNKQIIVESKRIISHSKALRFSIPALYMKLFDLKAGHKFTIDFNEQTGALTFNPTIPIERKEAREVYIFESKREKSNFREYGYIGK